MQGELALVISLTAYGNEFLASPRESGPPELVGANSTFRYVASLEFHRSEGETPLQSVVEGTRRTQPSRLEDLRSHQGTSAWFLQLRRAGALRLRIVKLPSKLDPPEFHAASFAGGIPWAILVGFPSSSELWVPKWKHEGGKKPWKVYVSGFAVTRPPGQASMELTSAAEFLREVLKRALDLSTRSKLEWTEDFSQALALLDSRSPEIPHHPDLLPSSGYSLFARQVMASGVRAWVFGGMGSFNDGWFGDPALREEYEALVPSLYGAVVNALLAATNSFG